MKGKLASVLVCMLSLLGCNSDVEKPEHKNDLRLETVMGTVIVQDANRNPAERQVTAQITGNHVDAVLRVASITENGAEGTIAELTDASGRLLFSLAVSVDNSGQVTYREATAEDYVAMTMNISDERVLERYDANGDVASFVYPALSDEQQRHAINYLQHDGAAKLPSDVEEYVHEADAFETYYLPHSNSSIHGNPWGELLMQLISSPQLPQIVVGTPDEPKPEMNKWVEQLCNHFGACAFFACRLFPLENPICWYCSAISAGCTIMMLGCMWFGC